MNEGPPPGWYPDPSGGSEARWWDGQRWTDIRSAPVGTGRAAPYNGFAIAALLTSLLGGCLAPILGPLFGFIARRQIRQSAGGQRGKGMALAGILLGAGWIVVLVVVLVIVWVTGGFEEPKNVDDFDGEEREIAALVDRFEQALEDEEADVLCEQLITVELMRMFGAQECDENWLDLTRNETFADIEVREIVVTGDTAVATADEGEDESLYRFEVVGSRWRIANIEDR